MAINRRTRLRRSWIYTLDRWARWLCLHSQQLWRLLLHRRAIRKLPGQLTSGRPPGPQSKLNLSGLAMATFFQSPAFALSRPTLMTPPMCPLLAMGKREILETALPHHSVHCQDMA